MYICDKCNKEFNYKYLLTRHFNNKNGCGAIKHTINDEDNLKKKGIKIFRKINTLKLKIKKLDNIFDDNKCGYCNKIFSNKSNLKIHIKNRCQNKKTILNDIQKLTDELEQSDNQYKSNKLNNNQITNNTNNGTINNTTNNNNINNINNTNIINISVNLFGKEDLSHITDSNYKKYMLDIFPGFVNFITKNIL